MKINIHRGRTLVSNSQGQMNTVPMEAVILDSNRENAKAKATPDFGVALSRSTGKNLNEPVSKKSNDVSQETAAGNTGSASSSIGSNNIYAPILSGYLSDNSGKDQQGNKQGLDQGIYDIYRDIYSLDAVAGSAVDLMSNMPFSDFSLSGAKEAKHLVPYEQSIDNMRMRSLFPTLSTEYLVHGLFCSTTLFDEGERVFKGIVPQNVDYVDVTPMPVWGHDPLIQLRIGDALKKLSQVNDDRTKDLINMLPDNVKDQLQNNAKADAQYTPDPENVIYIPRGGLLRDTRGVSIYHRIVPMWLIEKALYRGTLDQSMKRQRAISHMVIGDDEWEPTTAEMQQLAQMLLNADLDPVGAVFVTRTGVNVSDIRRGDDMWKVTDMSDIFTTTKLRALGISETFLTGDATYNSLEQVMSVFVEQMRAYRERVTAEMFYERTFPRIADANGYTNKRHGLSLELAAENKNQLELPLSLTSSNPTIPVSFLELAAEQTSFGKIPFRHREQLIPQVHWHKRLRPEADDAYLTMLGTLSDRGVPIPVRLWAAAGGIDIQSLVNQRDEDMKIREGMKDWLKAIGKTIAAAQPPVEGEGMPNMGGGGDEGGDEFASLLTSTEGLSPRSLLEREYGDEYEVQNRGGDGKRHILSTKGQQVLNERINKQMAVVAGEVNRRQNKFEELMEQRFNELNSKPSVHAVAGIDNG